jgi:hypothetical protein
MRPSAIASRRVVVVDSGPLVAAIDAGDPHHRWARATLPKLTGRLLTCEAVASEAAHLLDNDPTALRSLHGFLQRMDIVPILRDELDAVFARLTRFCSPDGLGRRLSRRPRRARRPRRRAHDGYTGLFDLPDPLRLPRRAVCGNGVTGRGFTDLPGDEPEQPIAVRKCRHVPGRPRLADPSCTS